MIRTIAIAAATLLAAGAAQAGGASSCAITGTCGSYAAAPGGYVQGGTVVIESTRVTSAVRSGNRLICPYPHRPSDSVFIGGAGYLTKDQLRRNMGCR